jgi:hypothetical protein
MHLPDPDLLAVSTLGGRIIIWQLSSGEELRRLSAGAQADEVAVMPAMDRAVTRAGRSMRVWNTKTGEEISARLTEGSQILHMTISPDGTHVAYGVPRSVEDQTDTARHAIEIWRVDDHAVQTIPLAERPSAIAFDQGGQRLIAVVSEAEIRLWDVETGRQLAVVEPRPDGRFGSRIGFFAQGSYIYAQDRQQRAPNEVMPLRVWHITASAGAVEVLRLDRAIRVLPGPAARLDWDSGLGWRTIDLAAPGPDFIEFPEARSCCDTVAGDDRHVVSSSVGYEALALLDLSSHKSRAFSRSPHSDSMSAAAVSPDLGRVFMAERDDGNAGRVPGDVRWIDVASGETLATVRPGATISLILPLGDGAALLFGSPGGWIRHGQYERAYLRRPGDDVLHTLVENNQLGGASASPDGRLFALHEGLSVLDCLTSAPMGQIRQIA